LEESTGNAKGDNSTAIQCHLLQQTGAVFTFLLSEGIFFVSPLILGILSQVNLFRRASGHSLGLPPPILRTRHAWQKPPAVV